MYFLSGGRGNDQAHSWELPFNEDVWGACGRTIQKSPWTGNNFVEILMDNGGDRISCRDCPKNMVLRNTVVHGGNFTHPNQLIQGADMFLQDYKAANANEVAHNFSLIISVPEKWQAPPNGMYKLN